MDINPQLIQKYWLGQCSDSEKQLVEDWLNAGVPEKRYHFEGAGEKEIVGAQLWSDLHAKLTDNGDSRRKPYFSRRLMTLAASLVAFLIIFTCIKPYLSPESAIAYKEVSAPRGRQLTLTLQDGSLVVLNSGSSLKYPASIRGDYRKVYLEGEAYFSVARDYGKPFIVETRRTQTRVLGTRFNLRDFNLENEAVITLEEGKVEFSDPQIRQKLNLTPGYQAVLAGNSLTKRPVNVAGYLTWKTGVLHFDNTPLQQAMAEVERSYDVSIHIADTSLSKLHIKGSFRRIPVDRLMSDISFLLNTKYRIQNNIITIYQ